MLRCPLIISAHNSSTLSIGESIGNPIRHDLKKFRPFARSRQSHKSPSLRVAGKRHSGHLPQGGTKPVRPFGERKDVGHPTSSRFARTRTGKPLRRSLSGKMPPTLTMALTERHSKSTTFFPNFQYSIINIQSLLSTRSVTPPPQGTGNCFFSC